MGRRYGVSSGRLGRKGTSPYEEFRKLFGWRARDSREGRRSQGVMTASPGDIARFLGCRPDEVHFRRGWERPDGDVDSEGFDRFIADECKILAKLGRSRATYRFLCRGPEEAAEIIDGLLFVEHRGSRLVLSIGPLDPLYYGDTTTVYDVMGAERDRGLVDGLIERFFSEKALKNRVHRVSGEGTRAVKVSVEATLDNVVLAPGTREALVANTVGLLDMRNVYRKNGIPLKRGVLLVGPPGNGKTMVCRALANTKRFTVFWVLPGECRTDFPDVFDKAARQAPSIVLLEDVDLIGASRHEMPKTLGQLLNAMDGLVEADGVVTIATTNRPETLDEALANRPNRFDVRLAFPNPDPALRLAMLKRFTGQKGRRVSWGEWAGRTEGCNAAQLREVCYRAVKRAIEAGRLDREGMALLDDSDLAEAVGRVREAGRDSRIAGFHR